MRSKMAWLNRRRVRSQAGLAVRFGAAGGELHAEVDDLLPLGVTGVQVSQRVLRGGDVGGDAGLSLSVYPLAVSGSIPDRALRLWPNRTTRHGARVIGSRLDPAS